MLKRFQRKKRIVFAFLTLLAFLASGYLAVHLLKSLAAPCPSIQRGLAFLKDRYNPSLGLLNESPQTAPTTYWLTNDNALAAYAFSRLGQADLSATLHASMQRFGY